MALVVSVTEGTRSSEENKGGGAEFVLGAVENEEVSETGRESWLPVR